MLATQIKDMTPWVLVSAYAIKITVMYITGSDRGEYMGYMLNTLP